MIVGLLSDTHGRVERCQRAIELLKRLGAEAFIHSGDVGGEAVLDQLVGLQAWFVWGNTDSASAEEERYAASLGLSVPPEPPLRLTLDGKRLQVFHGHEATFEALERRVLREAPPPAIDADYVIHGHTHVVRDEKIGQVRWINPGALHRASTPTVATLDLEIDELIFWRAPEDDAALHRPRRYQPPRIQ